MRNRFVQGILLVGVAAVIAVTSNAVAGRTRRLVLPGWYPNATQVPAVAPEPAPTVTTSPGPGQPQMTVTTVPAANTGTSVAAGPRPAIAQPSIPTPQRAEGPAPTLTAAPAVVPTPTPSAPPAADTLARFKPHPDKPYVEISGNDVMALHKAGALFLDARRSAAYEEGHIQGARPYSVWESDIDEKVNKLFEERSDPDAQAKPIVIYCTGGACEDSHMLAQKLWGIQFNNVYVYKDGYPDWVNRGGPVQK